MASGGNLLVMCVTRLADGVCVACVDRTCKWVRPTKESPQGWRQLDLANLRDERRQLVIKVGNVVQWPLGRPAPREVHTEDVLIAPGRPRLIRALSPEKMAALCQRLSVGSLAGFLGGSDRSLMIVQPASIEQVLFSVKGKGGVSARLCFSCDGTREDLSVTDLAWRALGRGLMARLRTNDLSWKPADLLRNAGLAIRYLAVGKGQAWNEGPPHPLAGHFWPFVIGVFTEPPMGTAIDYANL